MKKIKIHIEKNWSIYVGIIYFEIIYNEKKLFFIRNRSYFTNRIILLHKHLWILSYKNYQFTIFILFYIFLLNILHITQVHIMCCYEPTAITIIINYKNYVYSWCTLSQYVLAIYGCLHASTTNQCSNGLKLVYYC